MMLFRIFEMIFILLFDVFRMYDLVHDIETIFHLSIQLTLSGIFSEIFMMLGKLLFVLSLPSLTSQ